MARPTIPGLTPEAERAVGAYLAQLESRIAALEGEPAGFEVKRSSFTARAGQVVTVEPPPAGLTVTLPAASAVTRRARVVVTAKNANPVRWEAAGGLVNGLRQVTSNATGAAEAICDGESWHVSLGAATSTGSAASTAGATYFLESSDTGLPNARVADDSTEIDLDYTTPALVSWFLKTASVVVAKLQDLTGLSVLGRAANSSGVMAAITASGARQVLRANDAGTALEWGNPVQVSDEGVDVGDFFNLDFEDGSGLGVTVIDSGSGRATITYGWDGLYVYDGAVFSNYYQGLQFSDGTGIVVSVTDNSPTGTVTIGWDGSTNLVTGWAGVLDVDPASGAHNPQVDVGQHINFGLTGPTTSDPQIRCGDATFRLRGAGNTFVLADGAIAALASTAAGSLAILQAQGVGSTAQVSAAGSFVLDTGGVQRVVVASDGEWTTPAGSSGQVWTHQGAGAPPVWAAVDLSSVTYVAGDGIDLTGLTFSVDVTDIVDGVSIEEVATNNIRRAALTGEVTASAGLNATTVTRSTNFASAPWTGDHEFSALARLSGHTELRTRLDATLAANANNVDVSDVNVYRVQGNGFSLTGMVASGDGQILWIQNSDSADPLIIEHLSTASSAANRIKCPGGVPYAVPPLGGVWARYDGDDGEWFLAAPESRVLEVFQSNATGAYSLTPPTGCTWFEWEITSAGGGGGGADADTDAEACAGSGGGAGATVRGAWAIVAGAGNITGSTGAGGSVGSNTGGNGGTGGNTTLSYNSVTATANGGGGGTGTSAGAGAGTATQMKVTQGGDGGGFTATSSSGFTGGDGNPGIMYSNGTTEAQAAAVGGTGGASRWGSGGRGGAVNNAAGSSVGEDGLAPGSGGGGAARIATGAATGAAGGLGAGGCRRIIYHSGPVPAGVS